MAEFGVEVALLAALLWAAFTAGLLIAFRRLRSLKMRLDRLVLDHNLLADRVLLFTLNRVPAEPIVASLQEKAADARREPALAEAEVHRLASPRLVT